MAGNSWSRAACATNSRKRGMNAFEGASTSGVTVTRHGGACWPHSAVMRAPAASQHGIVRMAQIDAEAGRVTAPQKARWAERERRPIGELDVGVDGANLTMKRCCDAREGPERIPSLLLRKRFLRPSAPSTTT